MAYPRRIATVVFLLACLVSAADYFPYIAPSSGIVVPPAGLKREQVPTFICLGIDDNQYDDGMAWITDTLLKGRMNPAGSGNPATFDGMPVNASFYVIGQAEQDVAWKKLYDAGFEVGGHTWTHPDRLCDFSEQAQKDDIFAANKYLVNTVGMPAIDIQGFRTPNLASSTGPLTFTVLKGLGYTYDGTLSGCATGGTYLEFSGVWPATMDNGYLFAENIVAPGFWQFPHCVLPVTARTAAPSWAYSYDPVYTADSMQTLAAIKCFDSNFWPSAADMQGVPHPSTSGADFCQYLKWELQGSRAGNRFPIDIGMHSDNYSARNTASSGYAASLADRRKAIVDFLDYAQTFPDVRIVSKLDVIRWMRKPVALTDISRSSELTFKTDNGSGNIGGCDAIASAGSTATLQSNQSAEVTVNDAVNYTTDAWAGLSWDLLSNLAGAHSVRITYRSTLPAMLRLDQSDLGDASYCIGLGATGEAFRTIERPLVTDWFGQLRPVAPANDKPLDLSLVTAVSVLATALDATLTGTIEVQSLEFFGAGTITAVTSLAGGASSVPGALSCRVMNKNLVLGASGSSVLAVSIMDMKGRVFKHATVNLSKGSGMLPIADLSAGAYLVSMHDGKRNSSMQLLID